MDIPNLLCEIHTFIKISRVERRFYRGRRGLGPPALFHKFIRFRGRTNGAFRLETVLCSVIMTYFHGGRAHPWVFERVSADTPTPPLRNGAFVLHFTHYHPLGDRIDVSHT
jgi:hypothetical protein